jgi:hypothetical protein
MQNVAKELVQLVDFEEEGYVHTKTLMACMELGRTISRKVNLNAFLFKATKAS